MAHKLAVALLCICVPRARMQMAVFVCGVGLRGGKVFRRDEHLLLRGSGWSGLARHLQCPGAASQRGRTPMAFLFCAVGAGSKTCPASPRL